MNRKIIYLLLFISLAFNIAFIGMFVWHRINYPMPPFCRDFKPDRDFIGDKNQHLKPHRLEFLVEREEFIECVRSEKFEEAKADSLLIKMVEKQKYIEEELGRSLIEMRKRGESIPDMMDREREERRNNPERRRK